MQTAATLSGAAAPRHRLQVAAQPGQQTARVEELVEDLQELLTFHGGLHARLQHRR